MLITKDYAKRLIKNGKAQAEGHTTDQPTWADCHSGNVYMIVTRFGFQRTDHYLDN